MRYSIGITQHGGQRGLTLIELIVSMVIISVALGGVLLVMNYTTSRSADPMIQHQAVAIAEAYMEEILLQHYDDPDDSPAVKEASRDLYDNVGDYDGLSDTGAENHNGDAIAGLENYTVNVTVAPPAAFGPAGNTVQARQITVRVQRGNLVDLVLIGYRADYD